MGRMKRVELLEALYLQGRLMRELQVYYFSLRKGAGRFPSAEAKKVLADSKAAEMEFDRMVRELDEWWDTSAPLSDPREGLELDGGFSTPLELTEVDVAEVEIPDGWNKLVYKTSSETVRDLPENGFYVDVITQDGKMYKRVWFDMFFHCEDIGIDDDAYVIAWTYNDTLNDGDDDIRI